MLYVHRSERADLLVDILGDILADPLPDPMVSEVVAVPTRGVERWLTQRLSHRLGTGGRGGDGVCANVDFPFPGSLVGAATARACGWDSREDPWAPERLVWPLLEVVDDHAGDPFLEPLVAHLKAASPDQGPVRRFATLRHLAELYHRYGVDRPDLVLGWVGGPDADPGWQAELWRRVRRKVGVASPAERLQTAATRLAEDRGLVDLPGRLSLFGLTRLPASYLVVLEALAVGRDVHLFLLHPSGALWAKVADARPPVLDGLAPRLEDPTTRLPAHPLLRSWGRDAREMQLVLASHGAAGGEYRPVAADPSTLLGRIQADIRADRPPPPAWSAGAADLMPPLDRGDASVRIHSCHGRFRQVEVIRDAVLHLLAEDPTLEPRDVIVMCPDIEAFAPLVHAVFGADDTADGTDGPTTGPGGTDPRDGQGGPRELRVRLADRSLRQTNPLLAVAAHLLDLAGGRLTASEVLDLVSREPVRRRFRFGDDDLAQIERWVIDMGVRWGLDADHRARWKLGSVAANTWSVGLDRLLLGVTMADEEQRLFAATLPLDDVPSGTVDLAGRLAELIDRLGRALLDLSGRHPMPHWGGALVSATEALAVAPPADGWQHEQLHRLLDEVVDETRPLRPGPAESTGAEVGGVLLDLGEVRTLLTDRLRGRPTRANFRTGDLTVCTLVPMRSVPHRVVCLLGLDDGVFPRHTERDGDDLIAGEPRVGDRDARSEDRQLLLDAVLAATEHLVITFSGRDERTNHERPPAVPIAELLDTIDRTVRVVDGEEAKRARDVVVVKHPLQSFDPRNFTAGALDGPRPWSFDRLNLGGALALTGGRREPAPFLPGRLPAAVGEVVQLESLVRFAEHPVRAFLRERLGVYARGDLDEVVDSLPIELNALQKWEVGDRLLDAILGGADLASAVLAEQARGLLPPDHLAGPALDEIVPIVEALAGAVASLPCSPPGDLATERAAGGRDGPPGVVPPGPEGLPGDPTSIEVNLRLDDGRLLIGTVPAVRGATIVRCVYSALGPKHRLAAWVRFLALSAARPDLAVAAATVGRGRKSRGRQLISVATIDCLASEPDARLAGATAYLNALVDLYDRGRREPLPISCATSAAWAAADRAGGDPVEAARDKWDGRRDFPGESAEPEHRLVLAGTLTFDRLLGNPPEPDECGSGWEEGQPKRIGRLAHRLWGGLLEHEHVVER